MSRRGPVSEPRAGVVFKARVRVDPRSGVQGEIFTPLKVCGIQKSLSEESVMTTGQQNHVLPNNITETTIQQQNTSTNV